MKKIRKILILLVDFLLILCYNIFVVKNYICLTTNFRGLEENQMFTVMSLQQSISLLSVVSLSILSLILQGSFGAAVKNSK